MIRQNCDKRLVTLYRIRICFAGFLFSLIFSASVLLFARERTVLLLFILVLSSGTFIPAAILLPRYWYEQFHYTRHSDWLLIEYGIIRHRCIIVPRSRLQYIAVKRSLLERKLGLCTLELSSGGSIVRLPGLLPQDAGRMKSLLEGWNFYRQTM